MSNVPRRKQIVSKVSTSNVAGGPPSGGPSSGAGGAGGVVTRLNRLFFEPVLMPGQYVRIQSGPNSEIFQLPRNDVPEVLPPVTINLASFTSPLSALPDNSSPSPKGPTKLTAYDMPPFTLAQYRFVALDRAVSFELFQPAAVTFMENKDGGITFHYGTTMEFYKNAMWSMLPEGYVWQDTTTITAKATSMEMNKSKYYARLMAFGYKYGLVQLDTNEIYIDEDTEQIFRVFSTAKGGKKYQQIHPMTVAVGRGNRR